MPAFDSAKSMQSSPRVKIPTWKSFIQILNVALELMKYPQLLQLKLLI